MRSQVHRDKPSGRVHFVNSAWYGAEQNVAARFRKALKRMTTTSPAQRLGIDIEQHGRVLVARLMGGPSGEFGPEMAADLDALVTRAETDDGVGAVVITGSHPGRFVAHAELRWLQEGGAASPSVGARGGAALVRAADTARRVPGVRELVDRTPLSGAMELLALHETFLRINRCGTVFIAALNGSALGLGSELALACDLRLMADGDFVIGQPEILLGFPPGGGGTQRLVRLIGTHKALTRMLDGSGLSPADAAEIGYVDEVLPADELLDSALALATHLAKRLKFAVAAVKRAAYIGGSLSLEDGLHLENAEFLSTLASPGAQAAMLAYMERTDQTGDLPLYDPPTYERTLAAGRFSGGKD
jgi:enoyl-CoA hydratase